MRRKKKLDAPRFTAECSAPGWVAVKNGSYNTHNPKARRELNAHTDLIAKVFGFETARSQTSLL